MARGIVTNEEGDIAMGCGAAGSGLRTSLFTTWTPLAAVTSCVPACLSACLASSRFLSSSSSSSVSFSVLSHLACLPSPWQQQQQEISEELVRAGCWLQRPALGVDGRREGEGKGWLAADSLDSQPRTGPHLSRSCKGKWWRRRGRHTHTQTQTHSQSRRRLAC